MEWEPTISDLYGKIVRNMSWGYRAMVRPILREAAENKCRQRNDSHVSEEDLVIALFDITPDPLQAETKQDLQAMGIDVDNYIHSQHPGQKQENEH